MLTTRIHFPLPSDPEPEDIFQSSLRALFLDDTQNSHGNPGDNLTYQSPHYGDIEIHLPGHVGVGRYLFAHYIWNAAVFMADRIEEASHGHKRMIESESTDSNQDLWNVRGERVIELGAGRWCLCWCKDATMMLDQLTGCGITAGTALPSIISIHSAASEVSITDHPSSPALVSGAIQANVEASLELVRRRGVNPQISINAHEWGSVTDAFAQEKHNNYTKVIAADCLWMPHQHRNLIDSITHFLSRAFGACALVVAGFHTGRDIVADFFRHFSVANGKYGMTTELCIAEIYESDMRGARRIWQEERHNETKEETKRWCVVARIVKSE